MTAAIKAAYAQHLVRKAPSLLWHYTSLKGLEGIVQIGCIWASDARFLNDTKEVSHANSLFRDAIAARRRNAEGLEEKALENALWLVDNASTTDRYQIFVSSFSESDDQLSQWRAYGPTAQGVCIGFDLRGWKKNNQLVSADVFAPCVYSAVRQRKMVEKWIDEHCALYAESAEYRKGKPVVDLRSKFDDAWSAEIFDFFGPMLLERIVKSFFDLGKMCTLIKHSAFAEEQEWRTVVSESRESKLPSPHKRLSRIGLSTFVPYIELPLNAGKHKDNDSNRIRVVRIGPHPEPDRAMTAMREFLNSHGLRGVEVSNSKIPFRTW